MLFTVRDTVSGFYPILLFFNQVYGACIKTYVSFRLNRQTWTRQKTTLKSERSRWGQTMEIYSNRFVHGVALLFLGTAVASLIGLLQTPNVGAFEEMFGSLLW
jgi:glycosyltransferase Alg8